MGSSDGGLDRKPQDWTSIGGPTAARSGGAPGKRTLTSSLGPGAAAPHSLLAVDGADAVGAQSGADYPALARSPSIEHTLSMVEITARQGNAHADQVLDTLAPAYAHALDALDGAAVQELGLQVVRAFRVVREAQQRVKAELAELDAPRLELPGQQPTDDDRRRLAGLHVEASTLDLHEMTLWSFLSWRLGPHVFRDRPVIGGIAPAPADGNVETQLAYEVMQVAALIQVVHDVIALVPAASNPATCEPLGDDVTRAVALKIAPWKGRAVNFAFLKAALAAQGVWDRISNASAGPHVDKIADPSAPGGTREEVSPPTGSLAQIDRQVTEQAKQTGATADVGVYDEDRAWNLLVPGSRDPEIGFEVLRMLMSADDTARARLVVRLDRMGRLETLCQSIGYVAVQKLWLSIADQDGADLLRPYFEGNVDNIGKSNTRRLDDAIDGSGGVEHYGLRGVRWVYHVGTFGFAEEHDDAYDEREQGFISTEDYHRTLKHALIKSALVGGAATMTGGAVGELAGGGTASLVGEYAGEGAGSFAGGVAEGVAGGSSGAVAGHVTHDLAGVALGDQASMSSLGDYASTALEGAKMGGALSLAGALTVEAAKHLPESVKTRAQALGARLSAGAERAVNPIRQLGIGARAIVRLTVQEIREWVAARLLPYNIFERIAIGAEPLGPDSLVSIEVEATRELGEPADGDPVTPLRVVDAYSVAASDAAAANVSTAADAAGGNVSALDDGLSAEARDATAESTPKEPAPARDAEPQRDSAPTVGLAAIAQQLGEIPVMQIAPGVVPIEATTAGAEGAPSLRRNAYYVSEADAAKMTSLFKQAGPEVRVIDYPRGILVRFRGGEWYFERLSATALADYTIALRAVSRGAQMLEPDALASGAPGVELGLPTPNAATIEVWGFRGLRRIQGRPEAEWTAAEERFYDEEWHGEPLLWAGHVGISFDGGETIFGMTPDTRDPVTGERPPLETAIERLKKHEAFPGEVKNDTPIFRRAAKNAAEHGWDTDLVMSVELVDPAFKQQMLAEAERMMGGKHDLGYQFPLGPKEPHPVKNEHYVPSKGYTPDKLANCAIFPERLGIEVPEASGNLSQYIPKLREWSEEAGPKDFRPKETP